MAGQRTCPVNVLLTGCRSVLTNKDILSGEANPEVNVDNLNDTKYPQQKRKLHILEEQNPQKRKRAAIGSVRSS